ncbi:RNA-directed DNA polymerase [Tindallia californiensis]|uniref:Reverse transcriptase (RNA-dependent DNA polymerase) n=1 Tax=Tindallia californiensis TaxID=159292 RepID=A0A1H3NWE6_9FIRM|nr:RNA-directed DNA polymerase [Tindallia californiensis]SDY93050.1 hypothetical protein SAMN05192546_105322 [Tindallia californiensis]
MNTPRQVERGKEFKNVFTKPNIKNAWKNYVRQGLRSQSVLDLHDYLDFHRYHDEIADSLINQIIEGDYKTKNNYIIKMEKKHGVCRHLPIPSPEDALVLQTIVEELAPDIKANEPSKRAYYSRSHTGFKSEANIDESFPYTWLELWPEFQKRIYEFSTSYNYIVITDIANYFDNISFRHLRNIVSSLDKFSESLIDLMFLLLESLVWRPDYLPLTGVGLPQINFDAPRLLAHALLFEIDRYMDGQTEGEFVRWMDDIDFPTDNVDRGKKILSDLDELLLTRGIRLNLGKTEILSSEQAKEYFLPDENRYLTVLKNSIERKKSSSRSISHERMLLKKRFKNFLKKKRIGRWEKVFARYYSMAGYVEDDFLTKYVSEQLNSKPGLRISIVRYYTILGFSKRRFKQLKEFLLSDHCIDDVSTFSVCKCFVEWEISHKSKYRAEFVSVAKIISSRCPTSFIGAIWIISKYGNENDLIDIINKNSTKWKNHSFVARQVAAVTPLIINDIDTKNRIIDEITKSGQLDALRVISNLSDLRKSLPMASVDKMYLTKIGENKPYPLSKFIIAYNVIANDSLSITERRNLFLEVDALVNDKIYKDKLKGIILKHLP